MQLPCGSKLLGVLGLAEVDNEAVATKGAPANTLSGEAHRRSPWFVTDVARRLGANAASAISRFSIAAKLKDRAFRLSPQRGRRRSIVGQEIRV